MAAAGVDDARGEHVGAREAVASTEAASASRLAYRLGLVSALLCGVAVRIVPGLSADFPLNDGGMFATMIDDLQRAHYALPRFTSYNGLDIPFAYPPLGFYLAAILADVMPLSAIDTLRFLPLAATVGSLGAFFLLARAMLPSRVAVVTAVLAFALLPRAFTWQIMGGGLTRSLGFLFGILAFRHVYLVFTRGAWRDVAGATVFSALTALSHIEMAWSVAFTSVLFFAVLSRSRRGFGQAVIVAAGTLALTVPWWGTVIASHGLEPFLSASHTGSTLNPAALAALLVNFDWTHEPYFPVLGVIGLFGAFQAARRGRWLLPLWLVTALALDPRKYLTDVTIPIALLIGMTAASVASPSDRPASAPGEREVDAGMMPGRGARRWALPVGVGAVVAYALLGALVAAPVPLQSLSPAEREAMAWVAASTPPDSAFAIVTGSRWAHDRTAEWFPALTGRRSVATVQGAEWLPGGAYARRVGAYDELQACAGDGAACVERWLNIHAPGARYVYLARRGAVADRWDTQPACCGALAGALRAELDYAVVFENADVLILRRGAVAESAAVAS